MTKRYVVTDKASGDFVHMSEGLVAPVVNLSLFTIQETDITADLSTRRAESDAASAANVAREEASSDAAGELRDLRDNLGSIDAMTLDQLKDVVKKLLMGLFN